MPSAAPIVTVDGPSGSGKGTISRGLASRLRWHLLDSGALYRLVALAAARRGNPGDPEELARIARSMDASFGSVGGAERRCSSGSGTSRGRRASWPTAGTWARSFSRPRTSRCS
jgi:cytidylate kinase